MLVPLAPTVSRIFTTMRPLGLIRLPPPSRTCFDTSGWGAVAQGITPAAAYSSQCDSGAELQTDQTTISARRKTLSGRFVGRPGAAEQCNFWRHVSGNRATGKMSPWCYRYLKEARSTPARSRFRAGAAATSALGYAEFEPVMGGT